jgi:transcriptional regulator GlxA family with amidase domain
MIHQNAEKNIGADDVVRSAHVCRRKLEYIFQKEFGHGIYQQILKVRVERSKVLLRNTDLPMIEIASHSGFGTVGRFEIAFRKFANCSPGNFRKSALQTAAGNASFSRRFESEEKSKVR